MLGYASECYDVRRPILHLLHSASPIYPTHPYHRSHTFFLIYHRLTERYYSCWHLTSIHPCSLRSTTLHFAAVNRHPVFCALLLRGAHLDKADKLGRMAEVLSEWVIDVDRELMERKAANREEGGGNVSSPGTLDGLEISMRKRLHVKQLTDHALNMPLAQIPLPHRPTCIHCRVLTQPQPRTSIKPTLIPSTQTDCDGVIDYCITSTKLPPYFGSPLVPPSPGPAPLSTTTAFRALATAAAPLRSSSSTLRSRGAFMQRGKIRRFRRCWVIVWC